MDSWAYKDASGSVGFSGGNWIFGGVNCALIIQQLLMTQDVLIHLCPVPPPSLTITATVCLVHPHHLLD